MMSGLLKLTGDTFGRNFENLSYFYIPVFCWMNIYLFCEIKRINSESKDNNLLKPI